MCQEYAWDARLSESLQYVTIMRISQPTVCKADVSHVSGFVCSGLLINKDSCSALVIAYLPLLTDRFAVMNTAEPDHLKAALAAHGWLIREWNVRIQRLLYQVTCLSTVDPQTTEPPSRVAARRLPESSILTKPEKYNSEPSHCRGFLLQCRLYFALLGEMSDEQKIAHITGSSQARLLHGLQLSGKRRGKHYELRAISHSILLSIW